MAVLGLLSALAGDPRLFAFAVPAGRYWVRVRTAGADGVSGPSTGLGVRVGCGAAFVAPANFVGNASGSAVCAWDARVAAIRLFTDDRSSFRGCDRESCAQAGYWDSRQGPTTCYTDAMGQEVPASDPRALVQQTSTSDSVGAPATSNGLGQFKIRRGYCQ